MGKRELLIILAFVLVGAGVYQLTVVRRETDRPFSFAAAVDNLRPRGRRDRATFTALRSGRIPAPAGITEVKVAGLTTVVVVGEERSDIAYEVSIEASGRDDDAARTIAESADVTTDLTATTLAIGVRSTEAGRWSSKGTVRVSREWLVTIEGTSDADLSNVRGVYLHRMTGDAQLRGIRGAVTGNHRNGKLIVSDVDRLDATLVQSNVEVTNVRESVRLGFRGGSVRLSSVQGSTEIDGDNYRVVFTEPAAPVHLTGADADVRIERPRASVRAEMRRSKCLVELDRAVPLSIHTTERTLEVQLDDQVPVTINARTTGDGEIDASLLGLSPEKSAHDSSLIHRFGNAAEIVLRNQRDVIVIARRKW